MLTSFPLVRAGNKDSRKGLDGAASDFPHREPIEYHSSGKKNGKNSDDTANGT